ncbi:allergen Tha p 1-like [Achroia grisella]|uniref:allergen Tha p 1-like n=1 Tax=Achroia grisella TaxID=688607 RepID=UPI0027D27471|nr:allergen Tha p 1-like [Achroia grisella]
MKYIILVLAIAAVAVARQYSSRHDNMDIETLVRNPKYMKMSVDCYLDKNRCQRTTGTLKRAIPEIVQTSCAKCTPTQKHILRRYIEELKKQLPGDYQAFRNKYDPNGINFENLESAIANS